MPNFGAGDLIEVRDPRSGDTFLYPFTKAVVPEIHVADGYLVIDAAARGRARRGRARLSFSADIITLFPELFPGPLGASVIGRGAGARACGRCGPRSCAISPPTGTARSTTRRRAAAPAWC